MAQRSNEEIRGSISKIGFNFFRTVETVKMRLSDRTERLRERLSDRTERLRERLRERCIEGRAEGSSLN